MSLEGFGDLTAYLLLIWHSPLKTSHACVSVGGLINCLPANSLSARVSHSLLCFVPLVSGHFVNSTLPMWALFMCSRNRSQCTEKNRGDKATQTVTPQYQTTLTFQNQSISASSWIFFFLNFFSSTQFFSDNKNGNSMESCHFSMKSLVQVKLLIFSVQLRLKNFN